MELKEEQYERISKLLPKQRGNVSIENRVMIKALLYIVKEGCSWRGLPKEFGNWHVVYKRYINWEEKGIILKIFKELAGKDINEINENTVLCLDSTTVKVHPNAQGALKKTANKLLENQREGKLQRYT